MAIERIREDMDRPEVLQGTTYKIKTPLSEHAIYITMNDIVLNAGTEHESRCPFELFVNSKNMEYFQWVVALTRLISSSFRAGNNLSYIVKELKSVADPVGGFWSNGIYYNSLVAKIGDVIETHLKSIGAL
jgi:hypothetical protein